MKRAAGEGGHNAEAVRRALVILVLLMVGLRQVGVAASMVGSDRSYPGWLWTLMILGLALLAVTWWWEAALPAAVVLFLAGLFGLTILAPASALTPDYSPLNGWTNNTALLLGFLPWVWVRLIVPVIAFVYGLILTVLITDVSAWVTWSMSIQHILAIGMATGAAVHALRTAADRADRYAENAQRAGQDAEVGRSQDRAVVDALRLVHDGPVNTLGAVAVSGADLDPGRVRARAAYDLARLDENSAMSAASVQDLSALWRQHCERLQVEVDVEQSCDQHKIPAAVLDTVHDVVAELLCNAAKHAPGALCRVSLRCRDGVLTCQVDDDGPGISRSPGQGLQRAADACQREGIDLVIPVIGQPASFQLRWARDSGPVRSQSLAEPMNVDTVMFRVAVPIAIWIGLSVVVSLAVRVGTTGDGWAVVLGGMWLASLILAFVDVIRNGQMSRVVTAILIMAAAIPPAYVTHTLADPAMVTNMVDTFGVDAAASALVLVVFLPGPRYRAVIGVIVVAGGFLLVVGSDPGITGSSVFLEMVTILVMAGTAAVFRRTMTRLVTEMHSQWQLAQQAARIEAATAAHRIAHTARLQVVTATSRTLLRQLADGTADVADPGVRIAAARESDYLRATLALEAARGQLGVLLARLIADLHEHAVALDVAIAMIPPPAPASTLQNIGLQFRQLLESCQPGDRVRISITGIGASATMTALHTVPATGSETLRTTVWGPDSVDDLREEAKSVSRL